MEQYEGEFEAGQYQGKGTLIDKHGEVHEGEFNKTYSFLNKVFSQTKESYTYLNNRKWPTAPTIICYPNEISEN